MLQTNWLRFKKWNKKRPSFTVLITYGNKPFIQVNPLIEASKIQKKVLTNRINFMAGIYERLLPLCRVE